LGIDPIEVAVTLDPRVHGFRPNKELGLPDIIAFNPFSITSKLLENVAYQDAIKIGTSPEQIKASNLVHTLLHEFTHVKETGHGEVFTSWFGVLESKIGYKHLAEIENKALGVYKDHGYEIERITKSLQDYSKVEPKFQTFSASEVIRQNAAARGKGLGERNVGRSGKAKSTIEEGQLKHKQATDEIANLKAKFDAGEIQRIDYIKQRVELQKHIKENEIFKEMSLNDELDPQFDVIANDTIKATADEATPAKTFSLAGLKDKAQKQSAELKASMSNNAALTYDVKKNGIDYNFSTLEEVDAFLGKETEQTVRKEQAVAKKAIRRAKLEQKITDPTEVKRQEIKVATEANAPELVELSEELGAKLRQYIEQNAEGLKKRKTELDSVQEDIGPLLLTWETPPLPKVDAIEYAKDFARSEYAKSAVTDFVSTDMRKKPASMLGASRY